MIGREPGSGLKPKVNGNVQAGRAIGRPVADAITWLGAGEPPTVLLLAALDDPEVGLLIFDSELELLLVTSRIPSLLELPDEESIKPQSVLQLLSASRLEESSLALATDRLAAMAGDAVYSSVLLQIKDRARHLRLRLRIIGEKYRVASFDVAFPLETPGIAPDKGPRDILTGLPLREHFESALAEMLDATPEVPLSVLRLSLDGITIVNETMGHTAGNSVIRSAAERLVRAAGPNDLVARLDGDEFAVLTQPSPTDKEPIEIANRILDFVRRTYLINGEPVNIGVSIGISRSPDDKLCAGILRKANLARSAAKASGKSRFCLYEAEMERRAQADRITGVELRRALALHQLEVHYQPQLDFATNRLVGFEALVRWRHPQRGLLSPGEFIPIAEEMGAIVYIGAWVLETACREATHWPPDMVVAVNASPSQFDTGRFVEWVQKALTGTGLPGERLEIEITEGILLRNDTANLKILSDLHSMKVQIAMDDFGTGYASLSQLAIFPFDKIKIDQSLAGVNGEDLKRRAIVRAVTSLGQSLGISTLAEGIETAGQLARLQQDGCSLVQGFLVGKAVPASELGPIISRWNSQPPPHPSTGGTDERQLV